MFLGYTIYLYSSVDKVEVETSIITNLIDWKISWFGLRTSSKMGKINIEVHIKLISSKSVELSYKKYIFSINFNYNEYPRITYYSKIGLVSRGI